MKLSDKGAEFIGRFEGFSAKLYNDPVGHCTIGYGHLVHQGNCNGSEPDEFKKGITKKRAAKLLREDAKSASAAIESQVNVPLEQHQFDALVSFVYNVGVGNFGSSTLLKKLNQKQYDAVPAQLDRWVFASGQRLAGLERRRKAEGSLFVSGNYG
jgi:lysozyme